MAEIKTKPTGKNVADFIHGIEDEQKRNDCIEIDRIMQGLTNSTGKMWGDTIVGYGDFRYKYASGRENDWFLVGFSPRKQNLTIYIMTGFDRYDEIMSRLGKFKTGKSCLYVKRLDDIDREVLEELITASCKALLKIYPQS